MSVPSAQPPRRALGAAFLLALAVSAGCDEGAATDPSSTAAVPAEPPPAETAPTETAPAKPPATDDAATGAERRPVDPLAPADTVTLPIESKPLSQELSRFFRLIEARDFGAARVRLRKYLNLNPNDGRAEFLFALSYHREKRYALARPFYEQAIQHAPDYVQSYYFYGWALYYLGEPDLARRAFETHLRFMPDEPDTHFALGLIALDANELDDAERRFQRTITLAGSHDDRSRDVAKARTRLADVLARRGDFEGARRELEASAALHPDLYETQYKLFRVLTRLGDEEGAAEAERRFLAAREKVYPTTSFPE